SSGNFIRIRCESPVRRVVIRSTRTGTASKRRSMVPVLTFALRNSSIAEGASNGRLTPGIWIAMHKIRMMHDHEWLQKSRRVLSDRKRAPSSTLRATYERCDQFALFVLD